MTEATTTLTRAGVGTRLTIYGVMIRPFRFEGRRFETRFRQEHALRCLLETLHVVVVESDPDSRDVLLSEALDAVEREAIQHIAKYLTDWKNR